MTGRAGVGAIVEGSLGRVSHNAKKKETKIWKCWQKATESKFGRSNIRSLRTRWPQCEDKTCPESSVLVASVGWGGEVAVTDVWPQMHSQQGIQFTLSWRLNVQSLKLDALLWDPAASGPSYCDSFCFSDATGKKKTMVAYDQDKLEICMWPKEVKNCHLSFQNKNLIQSALCNEWMSMLFQIGESVLMLWKFPVAFCSFLIDKAIRLPKRVLSASCSSGWSSCQTGSVGLHSCLGAGGQPGWAPSFLLSRPAGFDL